MGNQVWSCRSEESRMRLLEWGNAYEAVGVGNRICSCWSGESSLMLEFNGVRNKVWNF